MRLRHLGVGFVWAWIYAAFSTSALYPHSAGAGINASDMWLYSCLAVSVSLFALGFALQRRARGVPQWLVVLASAAMGAGSLASSTGIPGLPSLAVDIVAGVLTGTCSALVILLWCDALCKLGIAQAERALCLSPLPTLLSIAVLSVAEGPAAVAFVCALPLLAGASLAMTRADQASAPASACRSAAPAESREVLLRFARSLAVIGILYVLLGCIDALSRVHDPSRGIAGFDAPMFLGSALGIACISAFVAFANKTDFTALMRWFAPAVVIMLALFPWSNASLAAACDILAAALDAVFQAAVLICLVSLVKRKGVGSFSGCGLCQGIIQVGTLAGGLLGAAAATFIADGAIELVAFVLALICLFSLSWFILPRAEIVPSGPSSAGGSSPALAAAAPPAASGEGRAAPSPAGEGAARACAAMAGECGLTAREQEILRYLLQGYSKPYIRDLLVVSQNTVNAHVKHIYAKTGVHSRDELLQLASRHQ